jgi:hypothetical protein
MVGTGRVDPDSEGNTKAFSAMQTFVFIVMVKVMLITTFIIPSTMAGMKPPPFYIA